MESWVIMLIKGQASIGLSCGAAAGRLRGQASVEFLTFMAVAIAMLAVSMGIYSFYSSAAGNARRALVAEGMCGQVSSFLGSFASLGEGAHAEFSLPKQSAGENYTVFVLGNRSLVRVNYEFEGKTMGVGCRFPAASVACVPGTIPDIGCRLPYGDDKILLERKFLLNNTGNSIEVKDLQ